MFVCNKYWNYTAHAFHVFVHNFNYENINCSSVKDLQEKKLSKYVQKLAWNRPREISSWRFHYVKIDDQVEDMHWIDTLLNEPTWSSASLVFTGLQKELDILFSPGKPSLNYHYCWNSSKSV